MTNNNTLKLPAFFETKVKKPEKENSRIRSKEHVHGNWPTIIFIPSTETETEIPKYFIF